MKSKSTPLPKKPSRHSLKHTPPAKQSSCAEAASGPIPWEPEVYQLEGAKFLVQNGCGGLFLDPGLRKTSIVLAAVSVLLRKKLINKVVVVAPPKVCRLVWRQEVAKWKEFSHLRVVLLEGTKKERQIREDADIYLLSYGLLPWFFDVTKSKTAKGKTKVSLGLTKFKTLGADCLVCDEISKARRSTSVTFKILREAREHFTRVYGMTGSLSPRNLLDLFGVMAIIDGGYSLGPYITHYRAAYFTAGYTGFDYVLQPDADKKIYKQIAPFAFRLDAKDYIKLPELMVSPVYVELPDDVRTIYNQMERKFVAELDEQKVVAVSGGAAYGMCKQIANGGLYDSPERDDEGVIVKGQKRGWYELHDAKTQAVIDLLDELSGAQALIVYDYKHDLVRLQEALGKGSVVIGGATKPALADKYIADWNAGKLPFMLVHAASMGHGLNLQASNAHHVIWHSLPDNFELFDQLNRRLLRSGNKAARVFVHLITAIDTVDEVTSRRLVTKEKTQASLYAALREYTLQRSKKLRQDLTDRGLGGLAKKKVRQL